MGFFELRDYARKLRSEGYDATRYEVDMHGKVAFSLVTVILVFIGISFSLREERGGGVSRSIGAAIVIGFSYWLVHAFSLSLGRAGTLPPLRRPGWPTFSFSRPPRSCIPGSAPDLPDGCTPEPPRRSVQILRKSSGPRSSKPCAERTVPAKSGLSARKRMTALLSSLSRKVYR